jgi:hypothetical protein
VVAGTYGCASGAVGGRVVGTRGRGSGAGGGAGGRGSINGCEDRLRGLGPSGDTLGAPMKLSNEANEMRRKFVASFFTTNPEATVDVVQKAILEETGHKMSTITIMEIRNATLGNAPITRALTGIKEEKPEKSLAGTAAAYIASLEAKVNAQEEELQELRATVAVLGKTCVSTRGAITIVDVPAGTSDAVALNVSRLITKEE